MLADSIDDAFKRRRLTDPPSSIPEHHSEFGVVLDLKYLNWNEPKPAHFSVAAKAIHFLTPESFMWMLSKYMKQCLLSPKEMQGNDFTTVLFQDLSLPEENAISGKYWNIIRGASPKELELIDRWGAKMFGHQYDRHVDGFWEFASRIGKLTPLNKR